MLVEALLKREESISSMDWSSSILTARWRGAAFLAVFLAVFLRTPGLFTREMDWKLANIFDMGLLDFLEDFADLAARRGALCPCL